MQSNDARLLLQAVVSTLAAGAVAAVISGVVAGGKGAVGAVVGALLVILLMGSGLYALQQTARKLPHLFQMMGPLLYVVQLLLSVVFLVVFQDTTLFDPKTFALTLIGATLVWITAQTRGYMKAKILYVDPAASDSAKTTTAGSPT